MRLERDDAKIGLLVFLALALFLGLLFQRSLAAILKKEARLQVLLSNAADVAEGTEVQLQGLKIGQVQTVALQRRGVQYQFLVTLGLRTDLVLWQGTRAVVVAKPLGGSFVDLQLPPPEARTAVLEPGSLIPGATGPTLVSLVEEIQTLVRNANQGVETVRGQLQGKGLGALLEQPQVSAALAEVRRTLAAFHRLALDSQALVRHGDTAMDGLVGTLGQVQGSVASVQKLLDSHSGDLDAILTHLAATLKEMDAFTKELRALVRTAGPSGEESLKALERNLRATEELVEILKTKPNRLMWGKPSQAERDAAAAKVREARQAQRAKP